MNKNTLLALVAFVAFSASAIAQEGDYSTENGVYISAQGTLMQYVEPIGPGVPNFDDTSSASTLLVGYRMLGGKLAFEVGTMDELTFNETIPIAVPASTVRLGLGLDDNMFRALWRFAGRGDASFIVGAGYHDITYNATATTTITASGATTVQTASESESETSMIVGGEIDGPALTIRFAYEQFLSLPGEARNRGITFGVGYRF